MGGDLNGFFGSFAASAVNPRVLEVNPINVAGLQDVKLTVGLAGSFGHYEADDYLRVLIDPLGDGNFQAVAEFRGNANKALFRRLAWHGGHTVRVQNAREQ